MKYKVGDKVVIKPAEMMCKSLVTQDGHRIMKLLKDTDRVVTIKACREDHDDYDVAWHNQELSPRVTDDMILGYAFEWDQEIEVRDNDGQEWKIDHFCGYAPGKVYQFNCEGSSWALARPIPKKTIPSIALTIEGKDVPLTDEQVAQIIKYANI